MSDCPLVGCTDVYSRCDWCHTIQRVTKEVGVLTGMTWYACVDQEACGRRILDRMCDALRSCHAKGE